MTRRRRRRGGARCRSCGRPIKLLRSPTTDSWRPFEPTPVDGRTHDGEAYPAEALRTYRLRDLVEELMVRRGCSRADAETEAYDMPWYAAHRCPTTTTTTEPAEGAAR